MHLLLTADGTHYRRWVNLAAGLALPGSAQFLAGRRLAGLWWFAVCVLANGVIIGVLVLPQFRIDVYSCGPLGGLPFVVTLASAVAGLRWPMPRRPWRHWAFLLGIVVAIPALVVGVRTLVVRPYRLPTHSMEPTLMGSREDAHGERVGGDRFLVNVVSYRFAEPRRGDLVVFDTRSIRLPDGHPLGGDYWVKRLVGLPGETIAIEPPYVLVNGVRLTDPPIFRKLAERRDGYTGYALASSQGDSWSPTVRNRITLGTGEYFVLGDNSPRSLDSRYFGPIPREAIIGRAFYVFAPAERKGWIE